MGHSREIVSKRDITATCNHRFVEKALADRGDARQHAHGRLRPAGKALAERRSPSDKPVSKRLVEKTLADRGGARQHARGHSRPAEKGLAERHSPSDKPLVLRAEDHIPREVTLRFIRW